MAKFTKPQLQKQMELLEAQNTALTAAIKELEYCEQLPPHLKIYVDSVAQQNRNFSYSLQDLRDRQKSPEDPA